MYIPTAQQYYSEREAETICCWSHTYEKNWCEMLWSTKMYIRTFALSAWTLSLWNKVSEKINNKLLFIHRFSVFSPFTECTAKQCQVMTFKKTEQYFDSHQLPQGKMIMNNNTRLLHTCTSIKICANLCKNSTLFAGKEQLCYLLQRKRSNIQVEIKMLQYLSISTCFISIDLYIWDILPSLSSRSARI